MHASLRAPAWFGLYLALTLLPAGVAVAVDPFAQPRPALVEAAVALGFFAIPLVMMQLALVSHLRAASRPFGTDALVQFHQYVGILALVIVVAHPLLLNLRGLPWSGWNPLAGSLATRTGVAGTAAIVLLAVTSIWRARIALSYEWWRRLHLLFALATITAVVIHVFAVNGYSRAPILRWLIVLYAAACGSAVLNYRIARPLRLRSRPWDILDNRDEGASIRTLRLRPIGHAGFEFRPGQFAWLITGVSPWSSQQHPLSISSSAVRGPEHAIEFSVKALGDWSSQVVPRLRAGNRVWVDGPFGVFTPDRTPADGLVLIAGGIGIAPMRSMLLTLRDRDDRRPVMLFYAAHDETRLAFTRELDELRQRINLTVVYVLESPMNAAGGETGRITAPLLQRHLPAAFRRYSFFVCGPSPMMDAVEAMLIELGVPARAIDAERFSVA